jgi:probable dihydroxyacetone kinase regulator
VSSSTKQNLAISLKKLMTKASLDQITVKDLVAECGVNRQTFYYHFQDIYELLGWIFKSEALESIKDYKTYCTWQLGFLKIFQYVEDNRAFCLSTFHSLGRDHLESFLNSVTFDLLYGVVEELAINTSILEEDKRFIAKFYTFAFVSLMLDWLKSGTKEKPEIIIDKLNKLIDGDIPRAIQKYIG